MTPLEAIKSHCLSCAYTVKEVKLCPCEKCSLYPFRFGTNPFRAKREYSEEELSQLRERMEKARLAKSH